MVAKETGKILAYQHFRNAPFPVIVCLGEEMLIDFVNGLAQPLLRMSAVDAQGQPIEHTLPEIFSKDITKGVWASCLRNETDTIAEKQLTYLRGDKPNAAWFDVTTNPLHDEEGKLIGVIAYFSDVSQRVVASKAIDQRAAFLASFFKKAPIALVCYRGIEFAVEFANEVALQMWGKTLGEVQGKPIHEIFPQVVTDPLINSRHNESLQRLRTGESHIEKEVELVFLKNGKPQTGWYNYIHEPYTNSSGEIVGMLAIAIDVTDQVLSRKKLELVTDGLPSLVSYINSSEQYEIVNKAYETWFERSRNEVVGRTIPEVLGQEAYRTVKSHVSKVLSGEADSFEEWINYANGKRRYVSANYIPHLDRNHTVLGYIGLVTDHTERKLYEESLIEKNAQLRLIIEGIGIGTFDYNLQSGDIIWSPELRELVGVAKDSTINAEIARSVVHPEDLEHVLQQSNVLQFNHEGYMAVDYRIVRKDNGLVRWLHSRSKIFFTAVGDKRVPSRIIGFSIDITDRKIAEEKLKELTEKLESKVVKRTKELSRVNELLEQRNEDLQKAQSVLQQVIDSSIELIAVVDRDLKFLAVNSAFENFVHKSRGELIGKEIFVAYEGARGSRQVQLLEKAFAGEALHLRLNPSIARPDVWFDTHYVPLKINEKIEGVIALSRNITDIIKSEQELADANRQLREAQRLAKLGSWEWDVATGTVKWSDEMYNIYGYEEKFAVDFVKATERMSQEDADRSSKRTQEYIQRAIENFRNRGETVYEVPSSEIRITLPNGENKLLRNTGKIQLTSEGKLHRFLGVLQDVTQVRSVEDKLRQMINKLKIKNSELESFNYVASHDLKEPLRNIRSMIDLIRLKKNEDTSVYLTKIDRAAERMSQLIESILKLSEVSNIEIEFSQVDLNKVVALCKVDLESRINDTDAELIVEKLPTVSGNENQIHQVFSNLLSNSIKFCKTTPKIEVTSEMVRGADLTSLNSAANANKNYWCISIKDNGIGFDQQFKQQIFEPFQRLHGKADYAGTGIGLSIVKKIIEKHNGFIDAEAQTGKGAKFSVWLPASDQIEK